MGFEIIDAPQRSEAWTAARLGRLTASRAADMLATVAKGEAAGRRNLRLQLVLERLTGRSVERVFQSAAMLDGIEREAAALRKYEAVTGRLVRRTGFLAHSSLMAGASLDGHLGDFETVVEAKCPEHAAHLDYWETRKPPKKYLDQITHQLWITGARSADFLSFNPDFPERMQVVLVRVERDEDAIAAYDAAARAFLAEVDRKVQALATLADLPSVLEASVA